MEHQKINLWNTFKFYFKKIFFSLGMLIPLSLNLIIIAAVVANQTTTNTPPNSSVDFNDFFITVSFLVKDNLLYLFVLPLSWSIVKLVEELSHASVRSGIDEFFISTEINNNRKKFFWKKLFTLAFSFFILYTIAFSVPINFVLKNAPAFQALSLPQSISFLAFHYLIIPLFFILPLLVLIFALSSLESILYPIIKWSIKLALLISSFILIPIYKIIESRFEDQIKSAGKLLKWAKNNCLISMLTVVVTTIFLASLLLFFSYKNYQKKDLLSDESK
ncbi:hypothetical protein [endosymbiont GvMRE of Glomus versiforme]|uniref:hypothetical protein n=1 Tax=endosymbiont GvMRE of Glomus versiforme TaxID=2039283 RepID=UPI000EC99053|nr:hypothetical protein [endosymbiont GvMRE of Glomus versiforme]RHZ35292.1 hypothetical protein GvMRE_IIg64 [endosymbiont GvMRE of Glomus versiforme]